MERLQARNQYAILAQLFKTHLMNFEAEIGRFLLLRQDHVDIEPSAGRKAEDKKKLRILEQGGVEIFQMSVTQITVTGYKQQNQNSVCNPAFPPGPSQSPPTIPSTRPHTQTAAQLLSIPHLPFFLGLPFCSTFSSAN